MSQGLNSRQKKERLDQAIELAKKGQYSKARYMLGELHDVPRAQKILKQIEGRNDKLQGGLTSFFNGTLLIILGVGAVLIFLAYNSIIGIRDANNRRSNVSQEYVTRDLTGGQELYVDLVYLCYGQVDASTPSCLDWAATTITDYQTELRNCVLVTDASGIQYRGQEEDEVAACFIAQGIPPTA